MSKLDNLNPEVALQPFRKALGVNYGKIAADIKSWLGRFTKDIVNDQKDWKAAANFKLSSTEGYKVQLPPNDARSSLLCFGMRLNEIGKAGKFEIQAEIPVVCQAWIEQHKVSVSEETAVKA